MKIKLLLLLAGLAFGFALPILAQEQRAIDPQDRQQIEAAWMKFQEAHNKRDAAAIAALHTQDAIEVRSWVSAGGGLFSGRQAIEEMFKADFASNPGKMVNKLVRLCAIGDAICEIADTVVGGREAQTVVIYVRDGDAWKRRMTYINNR
jgi:uncharacterized protein (TIGR02246 family)